MKSWLGFFLLPIIVLFLNPTLLLAAETRNVDIAFVSDLDAAEKFVQHRNGAALGVAEANIQGQFLGVHYTLLEQSPAQARKSNEESLPAAVIVAGDSTLLRQMHSIYLQWQVPVFNVVLADDELRRACIDGLFHILPSDRMLADAEAQWHQQHPQQSVTAVAWHPQFMKFAARDLNKRYREKYSLAMDSNAWAGWAAARVVAEAVVRSNSDAPAEIGKFLRESLQFDGQKGMSQSFRNNGQMRQPLLLIEGEKLLGEAPVRGVASFEDLDSLGITDCQ